MSGKRIFISDIHLGDDARYWDPIPDRRARFFPSEHRDRLLNFLDKQIVAEKDNVKDLVLLGDVFDTWVCPFDALPPTYDSIFGSQENKPILDRLRQIAASNTNLCYVNGNHDYELTDAQLQAAIPGIVTKPDATKMQNWAYMRSMDTVSRFLTRVIRMWPMACRSAIQLHGWQSTWGGT